MINGKRSDFGVSGLLYRRNLLLFDRETDSLWSQLLSEAVTGPLARTRLNVLPAENTTWDAWRKSHRDTLVLALPTGYGADYNQDPYAVVPINRNPGLLVSSAGVTRLYPFSELMKVRSPLLDQVGGRSISVVFERKSKTARVEGADVDGVTWFVSYFDDLKVIYPRAEVFRARHRGK